MAVIGTKDSHVADMVETLGNLSFLEYQQILAGKKNSVCEVLGTNTFF